jgi:KTSC domain
VPRCRPPPFASSRYDAAKRELQVTFVTGRRYVYDDVPLEAYEGLRTAPSKGTFFNREIRERYAYREIKARSSERAVRH